MDTVPHHTPDSKSGLYYVYTLAYPTDYPDALKAGIVFYVGKGRQRGRYDRIKNHESEAAHQKSYCKNKRKLQAIREIWGYGRKAVATKIAFFEQEEPAYIYEWGLINLIYPSDHLTNIAFNSRHPRLLGQYRILLSNKEMLDIRQMIFDSPSCFSGSTVAMFEPDCFACTPGKNYEGLRAPDGTEFREIPTLGRFCEEHGLDTDETWRLIRRQTDSYCGWTAL